MRVPSSNHGGRQIPPQHCVSGAGPAWVRRDGITSCSVAEGKVGPELEVCQFCSWHKGWHGVDIVISNNITKNNPEPRLLTLSWIL